MVLEALGYTGKEKQGQDGGVLPVEQANDLPARVRRPPDDNITRLEIWMANAEVRKCKECGITAEAK